MHPVNASGNYGFAADSSGTAALEFLERSRDVASEVVSSASRPTPVYLTGSTVARVTVRIAKLDCTLDTLGRRVRC